MSEPFGFINRDIAAHGRLMQRGIAAGRGNENRGTAPGYRSLYVHCEALLPANVTVGGFTL
jgi:hypothetical protein